MDPSIERALMAQQQAYADAETYSDWAPPVGEYTALVTKVDSGEKEQDDGTPYVWIALTGKILDPSNPEVNDKEFRMGFAMSSQPSRLKTLVLQLTGEKIDNIVEAVAAIEQSVGNFYEIKVVERYSKKTKQTYTNVDIVRPATVAE